jgi:hypothetical protein
LRPQVFSTSRRFHPPRACWPYFMPDPLVGLHPSEPCSSRVAVRRLRRLALLDVGCPPNSASRAHRSEHRASSTPWCLHPKTQTFQNRPLPLQSAEAFHNNMRIGPPPSRFTEMSRATRPASFSSCCAEAPHSVSPLKPSRHRQPKPATNSKLPRNRTRQASSPTRVCSTRESATSYKLFRPARST